MHTRDYHGIDDGLYDARSVSNYILDNFDAVRFDISNLKLNKVLYFVHGAFLGKFGVPFIKNHFEPWDYGPVVPVVYNEFKVHQAKPISTRARYLDLFTKRHSIVSYSQIDKSYLPFLSFIAGLYVSMPAGRLVDLTHKPGSPWSQARARVFSRAFSVSNRLRNDEIREYFVGKSEENPKVSGRNIDLEMRSKSEWNKPRIIFDGPHDRKICN